MESIISSKWGQIPQRNLCITTFEYTSHLKERSACLKWMVQNVLAILLHSFKFCFTRTLFFYVNYFYLLFKKIPPCNDTKNNIQKYIILYLLQ